MERHQSATSHGLISSKHISVLCCLFTWHNPDFDVMLYWPLSLLTEENSYVTGISYTKQNKNMKRWNPDPGKHCYRNINCNPQILLTYQFHYSIKIFSFKRELPSMIQVLLVFHPNKITSYLLCQKEMLNSPCGGESRWAEACISALFLFLKLL